MKKLGFLFLLFTGLNATAQAVLNNYKYVIVPVQFDGFRSENQYQTSTTVKYYLSQNGMNAYYENTLPEELNSDRCKAVRVSLDDQSGAFVTRVVIVFKDCVGRELYRTEKGESRIKSYIEAYREAIGEAFKSLIGFQYRYQEKENPSSVIVSFKDDIKKMPTAPVTPPAPEIKTEDSMDMAPGSQDKESSPLLPLPEEKTEAVTLEEAVAGDKGDSADAQLSLYAQKTETGFQLVDTTPSIRFYLQETSLPNVFLAQRKGQEGIVFELNGVWIFEYYQGMERIQEELQIKF